MALTEERLKEIEAEVGSQPYSVVLGLVFEIRYLRKELKESREAALEECKVVREALVDTCNELQEIMDGQVNCGDPDKECPLQDCHKDWSTAGVLRKAQDALKSVGVPTS